MRLTDEQRRLIVETVDLVAGEDVDVYLFGSRLDDGAKGGDVDLFLEAVLGLPVDVVCQTRRAEASPFQAIAKSRAVKLGIR